jgi:uncharacterized delta-60 repeat protein
MKRFLFLLLLLTPLLLPLPVSGGVTDGFYQFNGYLTEGEVRAVAVQPWDGKVILGGLFTVVNGGGYTQKNLVRINTDGTLDSEFRTSAGGAVEAIVFQPDPADPGNHAKGFILVGGRFPTITTTVDDGSTVQRIAAPRYGLARLNLDGSLDDFNPATGPGSVVKAIALMPEKGSIVVGGAFTEMDGAPCNNIARLSQSTGSLYSGYSGGVTGGEVSALLAQGKTVTAGGSFTSPRQYAARFLETGLLDESFFAVPDGPVRSLALQVDSKIVMGGEFAGFVIPAGTLRNHLARVTNSGIPDDFDPSPDGPVSCIAIQPDGKILIGGEFTAIAQPDRQSLGEGSFKQVGPSIVRNYLARLNIDGSLDRGINGDLDDAAGALALQPDGKFLAAGKFGASGLKERNMLARFYREGTLDDDVAALGPTLLSVNQSQPEGPLSVALHPDGYLTLGGGFDQIGDLPRTGVARLKPDWTVADDEEFKQDWALTYGGEFDARVPTMALQPDGKVVLGGGFVDLSDDAHYIWYAARVGADGAMDGAFNDNISLLWSDFFLTGVLIVAPNGRTLPNGEPDFSIYLGGSRKDLGPYAVRLNNKGERDSGFDASSLSKEYGEISCMAIQPDKKLVVGTRTGVVMRLTATGGVDPDFRVLQLEQKYWIPAQVTTIAIQANGQILVGGTFTYSITKDGKTWEQSLLRLDSHGNVDENFTFQASETTGVPDGIVTGVQVQADQSIVISGVFKRIMSGSTGSYVSRDSIARLTPDGALDLAFGIGTFVNGWGSITRVNFSMTQQDGKVIIGGPFTSIDGDPTYQELVRSSKGWATEELTVSVSDAKVTWMRGGTGPELALVTMEHSADGANWEYLGEAYRIDGGWELDTSNFGEAGTIQYIRARGYLPSQKGGTSGILESVRAYYPTATTQKQLLWVTTVQATREYGAENPVFQARYVDPSNPEQTVDYDLISGSISGSPVFASDADAATAVGSYPVRVDLNTLSSSKYSFQAVNGAITIATRKVTVTADSQEKYYGDPDPALTFKAVPGLVPGDLFSGGLSRATGRDVGSYAITQGDLALSGNYDLKYAPGASLAIKQKTVTVTADSQEKYYGDPDPALTFKAVPGLVPGDLFSGGLSRVTGRDVGSYAITQGDLALSGNYDLKYAPGNLVITPRPASVTPVAAGKAYGSADPPFSGVLNGFLESDGVTASYTRNPGERVSGGPYRISATLSPAGVLGNYNLTYNTALFTIGKKDAVVKAEDAGKLYGQNDPLLQCTKIDFAPDDLGVGKITCYSLRASGENAKTYPLSPALSDNGTGLLANYNVDYRGATFTIAKAPLTVTADNKSRPFGGANPELTVSYEGLANFDSPASLGGVPALTTSAGPASPRGSYPILVGIGSLASPNYGYSFVNGLLTVTGEVPQSITFNAMRPKTYGDADFDPGATASSGLPVSYRSSDERISTLAGSKLRVMAPGSTVITASQPGDEEYQAAQDVPQTLKVNPPPWNGLGFDGIDDLMLVPDAAQLNFGAKPGLTIETWLHLYGSQPDGTGTLSKVQGGGYQLLLYRNRIAAEISDGARSFGVADGLVGTTALSDGQWHHVAFSLDRVSGTASLYLDGRLEAQVAAPLLNPDNASPLRVGVDASGTHFFKGELDELRLWDSARSRDEIRTALAEIIDPLNEPHLMAYFHFDEGDATEENGAFGTAPERTANGAQGTLQGFALSGPASNWIRSGAFLPLLETSQVSFSGDGTATSGGLVYPNYYPATDLGICWGEAPNPTLADHCVHAGSGAGPFSAALNGITPGGSYHVRAFAVNSMGSAYGNDIDFHPARLGQSISFALPGKSYGDLPFDPAGSATSGLPVSYTSSNAEVAVVTNGEIVVTGAGSTTITASQSGDETFGPAQDVAVQLEVAKAPLTVRADNKSRAYLTPNPTFTASISGFVNGENGSVVTGAPVFSTPATLESAIGEYDIVVGTGSLAASNYRFLPVNGVLKVLKSCQEIIFPAIGERTYGDPPFPISASSCSGLGLVFTSSNPQVAQVLGNTVTITGAGSVMITASQVGSDGMEKAPEVSQGVIVHKSGQLVSLPPLAQKVLGDPPFILSATASSGLPVSYLSSDTTVATVSGSKVTLTGAGTTVITALQEGSSNYNAALPASQPLVVSVEGVPPTLLLSTVSSGSVTSDPVLNITGSASDPSGIASVTVNGADVAAGAGVFSSAVSLAGGDNSVEVTARDRAGNHTTQTLSVKLDALAPLISVALPDNSVTNQSFFTATGKVSSRSSLTMSVNGASLQSLLVSDGNFSGSGYLEEGMNTVEFAAELEGRGSRVKRTVTFAPGKPVAAITFPAEDARTEQQQILLSGLAATDASVVLEVDGATITPAVQGGAFQQQIALSHPGLIPVVATVTDNGGNSSVVRRNIVKMQRVMGDLNGDGLVNIQDAMTVLRMAVGLDQVTPEALAHADVAPLVNGVPHPDGKIDVGDVLIILRKVVGLVDF